MSTDTDDIPVFIGCGRVVMLVNERSETIVVGEFLDAIGNVKRGLLI